MAPPVTPKPATPTKGMEIVRDLLTGRSAAQREAALQGARYAGRAAADFNAQSGMSVNDEQRLRDALARTRNSSAGDGSLAQQEADIQGRRYAGRAQAEWAKLNNPLTQRAAAQITDPTLPTSPGSPQLPSPSGGGSSRSSGGGGVSATPQDPLAAIMQVTGTIDPQLRALVPTTGELELMYKRLTDEFDENQARLQQDYADSIKAIQGNFDQSNQYIQGAISGDQDTLAKAAANLGISPEDWQSGATAESQVEALNRLLGSSSQNEATDLAWFEKMKTLDASNFDDYSNLAAFQKQNAVEAAEDTMLQLQQYANQIAQAQALQELINSGALGGGGSGGGGRSGRGYGGGGGGSSSDPYTTLGLAVDEDSVQKNAGIAELIASYGDQPELQDWLYQQWIDSGNSVTKMLGNLYDARNDANASGVNSAFNDALSRVANPFRNLPGPLGDIYSRLSKPVVGGRFSPETIQELIYQFMPYDETLGWNTDRQISTSNSQKGRVPSAPIEQVIQMGGTPNRTQSRAGRPNSGISLGRRTTPKKKTTPSRNKPAHLDGSKFF